MRTRPTRELAAIAKPLTKLATQNGINHSWLLVPPTSQYRRPKAVIASKMFAMAPKIPQSLLNGMVMDPDVKPKEISSSAGQERDQPKPVSSSVSTVIV